MKRLLILTLTLLLLNAAPALANGWGLKGDLLTAVMSDHTWDDYHTMGNQVGNVAAMTSRYHNALMLVMDEDAPLMVYTRALWQPDDERGSASLTRSEDGFTLSYGKSESYRFTRHDDGYLLQEAVIGDFTLTLQRADGFYIATENGASGRLYLYGGITLDRFSIRLLPRTMEELRRFNLMRAALDTGADCLGWWDDLLNPGMLYEGSGKGTVPVWGAPDEDSAWRGGKGKASVSLNRDVWVLQEWVNSKGESYLYIRYEVSQRTHRFGFVRADLMPGYPAVAKYTVDDPAIRLTVRTAASPTIQTDDPLCSQFSQFDLPAGVELECIGMFNDEYALVRTSIGSGEAWLFVPLKDLEPVSGTVQTDVMAALDGCWYFWAGGNMSSDYLRLNADGTFYDPSDPASHGTWTVTSYDPSAGLYWNDPPYEITLRYADGRVNIKGLTLETGDETGFSLTNWEGGGGYIRIDESTVPLLDSEDGHG